MKPPTEYVKVHTCVVCGEELTPPLRRWIGCLPICPRCETDYRDTLRDIQEDGDENS